MRQPRRVHDALLAAYGPQHWWPAQDAFEIIAGAVLVQRTTWNNAEAAIRHLGEADLLTPERLAAEPLDRLEALVRPAGFFRVKATRLREVARGIAASGGIDGLRDVATGPLREFLLGLHGVGAETADTILLYAFDRPVVVLDAYLRRLVRRMEPEAPSSVAALDGWIRESTAAALTTAGMLNEFHALVVEHGKRTCRPQPRCSTCALKRVCNAGRAGGTVSQRAAQRADQPNPSPRR